MTTMENSSGKVLFQTANAYLRRGDGKGLKPVEVKVMFDSCSDRSYITTAACKRLKLRYHKENLNVSGFGGTSEGAKSYNIRHAILQAIPSEFCGDSVAVKLVETEKICPPISWEAIPADVLNAPFLKGLTLAEDYSNSSCDEIDVLVGLDYYWDFITGGRKTQAGMPVAIDSVLGWMLQTTTWSRGEHVYPRSKEATALVISTNTAVKGSRADESKDWRQDSRTHSVYKQGYKRRSNGGENCSKRNWYSGSPNIPYQYLHRNRDKFADGRRNRYGYSLSRFKKDEDKYYTPYSSFYSDQV